MADAPKEAPKERVETFSRNQLIRSADTFSTDRKRVRSSDVAGALRLVGYKRSDRTGDEDVYTREEVKEALRRFSSEDLSGTPAEVR
jgi:hypothetical protein